MEENPASQPTPKKKSILKLILFGVGGFVVIIIVLAIAFGPNKAERAAMKHKADSVAAFAPKPAATAPATTENTPASVVDAKAIEDKLRYSGMDIASQYDPSSHEVVAVWTPGVFFDEKTLISDHFSKAVNFAKKAFDADSAISTVSFTTRLPQTDATGKIDTLKALSHTFNRSTFRKIIWENLADKPIYKSIALCVNEKSSFVAPWILKKLDEEYVTTEMTYNPYK